MAKGIITPSNVVVTNIQSLPDVVTDQAITLKPLFDKTGADTKDYINNTLIAELNGNSGSNKIGHDSPNLASDNVKDALEELQSNIQSAVVGAIPDGTITDVKLSNTAGQIKDRVTIAEGEIDTLETNVTYIKSDLDYLDATIVSRQIRVPKVGNLPVTRFKISSSIATGTQITISFDSGATSLTLVDTNLGAITEIDSGIHEIVLDSTRYILNPFGQVKGLFADVGSLPSLLTTDKSSLVNAINELFTNKANKTQEAWISPTLLYSWVNFGAPVESAGYFKDEFGIVHLKGSVKNGTTGGFPIFVLSPGYRPANDEAFAIYTNTGIGQVTVDSSGNVFHVSGGNTFSSLSGITFKAV